MPHNKLRLTIEMDLDVETLRKNNVTLEKTFDWIRIHNDAVLNGFVVHIDAPGACASDESFHLPGGFCGLKRPAQSSGDSVKAGQVRETCEIVQQGNPFLYIKGEEDVVRLANSLIRHTRQKPVAPVSDPFWENTLKDIENALLQACCYFLWYECPEKDHNLFSVLKLLETGCDCAGSEPRTPLSEHCVMNYLFENVAEREPDHPCVSAFACAKSNAGITVAREALLSCIHRIESMTLSELHLILTDMKVTCYSKTNSEVTHQCLI